MLFIVPSGPAAVIRRTKGATVNLVNQTAVDVYFDTDAKRLNASVEGAVPSGTKIAATTGEATWAYFPGEVYVRAATQTTLEVQP